MFGFILSLLIEIRLSLIQITVLLMEILFAYNRWYGLIIIIIAAYYIMTRLKERKNTKRNNCMNLYLVSLSRYRLYLSKIVWYSSIISFNTRVKKKKLVCDITHYIAKYNFFVN